MNKNDLLQGTLELLILRVLVTGSRHGYGIAKRIEQVSGEAFIVQMGSLYPALNRLEAKALVTADWGKTDTGRRAKFYTLTKEGEARVDDERDVWDHYVSAINLVLKNA